MLFRSWDGIYAYAYPTMSICSNVSSSINLRWFSYERPNRFTLYDDSGEIATTGWKGYANYPGPWGLTLNTATDGYLPATFTTGSGRYLLVEAGGAGPSELSDTWNATIIC